MKFLEVVTPPTAIYHGCYTLKTFWEEKFVPLNMRSCGRRNISKDREIINCEQYIILEISYKLNFQDQKEVIYSELNYLMVIPGKELTNSMALRTRWSNNKKGKVFYY